MEGLGDVRRSSVSEKNQNMGSMKNARARVLAARANKKNDKAPPPIAVPDDEGLGDAPPVDDEVAAGIDAAGVAPPPRGDASPEAAGGEPKTFGFVYASQDSDACEISEFYSYAESEEFVKHRLWFEESYQDWTEYASWKETPEEERLTFASLMVDALERADASSREEAAHLLLYIAQGTFAECETSKEQVEVSRAACKLFYRAGCFATCLQCLHLAAAQVPSDEGAKEEMSAEYAEVDASMRLHLSLLYLMLMHCKGDAAFVAEMRATAFDNRSLILLLFRLIRDFGEPKGKRYPIKKMLLLLWKCLLIVLGEFNDLGEREAAARTRAGLPAEAPFVKCSEAHVRAFEENAASRYHHCSLPNSIPTAHVEGLATLKKNHYVSLAELQLRDVQVDDSGHVLPPPSDFVPRVLDEALSAEPAEILYRALLPNLSRYMIILLKTLLACGPTIRQQYSGTINLATELSADGGSSSGEKSLLEKATAAIDGARHMEILAKAISAILLLILGHAKLSHIYQFEHISKLLVDANCILLILKFLNQEIPTWVTTINTHTDLEFMSPDNEDGSSNDDLANETECSWRNLFTTVNLLHILDMLTSRNELRSKILLKYKAPNILRRLTKLPDERARTLALALIRSQLSQLSRKWKSSNMKVISQIYLHLPPDMSENYLCAPDVPEEAQAHKIQAKDDLLHARVDAFNKRNYQEWRTYAPADCSASYPVDDTLTLQVAPSPEGEEDATLAAEFKENYERWLELEVFSDDDDDTLSSGLRRLVDEMDQEAD